MEKEKQLSVSAIKNGTVLDHIPSNQLFKVIEILNLKNCSTPVTFGLNLDSHSMGTKGIIKISERFFEDSELNIISLYAPNASVNIIRNFEVVEKKILSIPAQVNGIVKCMNPVCVTNHEDMETRFTTVKSDEGTKLICRYCEKITEIK